MLAELWRQTINWLALPVLAMIAVLLLWRKAERELPHFFAYVVVVELAGLTRLFVAQFAWGAYLYTFWISDVLIAIFTFLVAYELFIRRLFPGFYAVTFYRYLFPVAGTVIAFIAVPAALANRRVSLLLTLIHGLEIFRVTVLLFFVGLMIFMGRRWTRYEFGIALGLGLQASAVLVTSATWTKSLLTSHVVDRLPLIAFDSACLIWLITFLKPERPEVLPTGPVSSGVVREAQKWEKTLKESLTGKKRD